MEFDLKQQQKFTIFSLKLQLECFVLKLKSKLFVRFAALAYIYIFFEVKSLQFVWIKSKNETKQKGI